MIFSPTIPDERYKDLDFMTEWYVTNYRNYLKQFADKLNPNPEEIVDDVMVDGIRKDFRDMLKAGNVRMLKVKYDNNYMVRDQINDYSLVFLAKKAGPVKHYPEFFPQPLAILINKSWEGWQHTYYVDRSGNYHFLKFTSCHSAGGTQDVGCLGTNDVNLMASYPSPKMLRLQWMKYVASNDYDHNTYENKNTLQKVETFCGLRLTSSIVNAKLLVDERIPAIEVGVRMMEEAAEIHKKILNPSKRKGITRQEFVIDLLSQLPKEYNGLILRGRAGNPKEGGPEALAMAFLTTNATYPNLNKALFLRKLINGKTVAEARNAFTDAISRLHEMMRQEGDNLRIRFIKEYTEINFNTMSHFLAGLTRLEQEGARRNGKAVKWQDLAKADGHIQMTAEERTQIYDDVILIFETMNAVTKTYTEGLVNVISNTAQSMNKNIQSVERLKHDKAQKYKEVGTKKANGKGKGKNKDAVKGKTTAQARTRAKATKTYRATGDRATARDARW